MRSLEDSAYALNARKEAIGLKEPENQAYTDEISEETMRQLFVGLDVDPTELRTICRYTLEQLVDGGLVNIGHVPGGTFVVMNVMLFEAMYTEAVLLGALHRDRAERDEPSPDEGVVWLDQFAVMNEADEMLAPPNFGTREEADGFRAWLYGQKFVGELLMLDEQRYGYETGNENTYRWERGWFGMPPLRDARYSVVQRKVSRWERA